MREEDGWLGYAHCRFSEGDYYLAVRVTTSEKELLDEYIESRKSATGVYLPSAIISSLAMKGLRDWKYNSSTSTKNKEES